MPDVERLTNYCNTSRGICLSKYWHHCRIRFRR